MARRSSVSQRLGCWEGGEGGLACNMYEALPSQPAPPCGNVNLCITRTLLVPLGRIAGEFVRQFQARHIFQIVRSSLSFCPSQYRLPCGNKYREVCLCVCAREKELECVSLFLCLRVWGKGSAGYDTVIKNHPQIHKYTITTYYILDERKN